MKRIKQFGPTVLYSAAILLLLLVALGACEATEGTLTYPPLGWIRIESESGVNLSYTEFTTESGIPCVVTYEGGISCDFRDR